MYEMKGFLIILFLAVLQNVEGQGFGACSCGVFLTSTEDHKKPDLGAQIYESVVEFVSDCQWTRAREECNYRCIENCVSHTGGSLDHVMPNGKTAGEMVCVVLDEDIDRREVAVFSDLCGQGWEFGLASYPPELCCRSGESVNCYVEEEE